jgi:hypothetical protein
LKKSNEGETMATSGKTKKSTKSKTAAKPRTKTIAADAGPVTLAEAKALAEAKQPKLAVRAARKSAAPPASPAAVGAERKNLEKERREEFKRRIREYKATMEIMKKRGARRPRPKKAAKPKGEERALEGESFVPLQIFAEGDPWFDYPVPTPDAQRMRSLPSAATRPSRKSSAILRGQIKPGSPAPRWNASATRVSNPSRAKCQSP